MSCRPLKRMQKLIDIVTEEIKILAVENEINQKAQAQMDENQREYFLKEQMRAIANELGEDDSPQQEADELREKVLALKLPQVCEETLLKECDKLYRMPYGSHEASVIRMYLDTCLELPWKKSSKEKLDLKRAQRILDRDHYRPGKSKGALYRNPGGQEPGPPADRADYLLGGSSRCGKDLHRPGRSRRLPAGNMCGSLWAASAMRLRLWATGAPMWDRCPAGLSTQ